MTAFVTAGEHAIVPASPMPLTPREFVGDGVSVRSVSKLGSSAAVGSEYSTNVPVMSCPFSS